MADCVVADYVVAFEEGCEADSGVDSQQQAQAETSPAKTCTPTTLVLINLLRVVRCVWMGTAVLLTVLLVTAVMMPNRASKSWSATWVL